MSEQLHLVDVPAVRPLTPRQQLALEFIGSHDGVTSDEVGAHLHAHRGRRPHSVDERCDWCARDGRAVATSVALKPLVTAKRRGRGEGVVYVLRRPGRERPAAATERVSAEIPGDPFRGL